MCHFNRAPLQVTSTMKCDPIACNPRLVLSAAEAVLECEEGLPDRVGEGDGAVVEEGDAPHAPAQQRTRHVAAQGPRADLLGKICESRNCLREVAWCLLTLARLISLKSSKFTSKFS